MLFSCRESASCYSIHFHFISVPKRHGYRILIFFFLLRKPTIFQCVRAVFLFILFYSFCHFFFLFLCFIYFFVCYCTKSNQNIDQVMGTLHRSFSHRIPTHRISLRNIVFYSRRSHCKQCKH